MIGNVHTNTSYTNKDHNSVLCAKELCEETIKSFFVLKVKCTSLQWRSLQYIVRNIRLQRRTHGMFVRKALHRKAILTVHLRIHSGEKPLKCDVCENLFTQNAHLRNHLRIHSGERPFKCDVCNKRFPQKNSLKGHFITHCAKQSI